MPTRLGPPSDVLADLTSGSACLRQTLANQSGSWCLSVRILCVVCCITSGYGYHSLQCTQTLQLCLTVYKEDEMAFSLHGLLLPALLHFADIQKSWSPGCADRLHPCAPIEGCGIKHTCGM